MPRKIRDLIAELEAAGFLNRGGKGSHRNFGHPKLPKPITLQEGLETTPSNIKSGPYVAPSRI